MPGAPASRPGAPVIVITAERRERQPAELGVEGFFAKPFEIDDLLSHVRVLLAVPRRVGATGSEMAVIAQDLVDGGSASSRSPPLLAFRRRSAPSGYGPCGARRRSRGACTTSSTLRRNSEGAQPSAHSAAQVALRSTHPRQLHLGLRQPERHPHLAEHRDRRRQLGAGLVGATRAAVELAEAEVAMGLERACQAHQPGRGAPGTCLRRRSRRRVPGSSRGASGSRRARHDGPVPLPVPPTGAPIRAPGRRHPRRRRAVRASQVPGVEKQVPRPFQQQQPALEERTCLRGPSGTHERLQGSRSPG